MVKPRLFKFNVLFLYLVVLSAGSWLSYAVFSTGKSIQVVSQSLTEHQLPALYDISELKRWINEYERILYELYATTHTSSNQRNTIYPKLIYAAGQIETRLNSVRLELMDNNDLDQLDKIFMSLKLHTKKLDEALPPEPYEWDVARSELETISQYGRQSLPHLESLIRSVESQILVTKQMSDRQLDRMSLWVSFFSAVIVLIAILIGYYIRRINRQAVEKKRLALFVENNPNPVACIDFDGHLDFKNQAWVNRYQLAEATRLVKILFKEIASTENKNSHFLELKIQDKSECLAVSVHRIELLNQYMVYLEDVTEKENSRKELEYLAYHDVLTNLPNLKKLELDMESLIKKQKNKPFCIISIGIERLKFITGTHGHAIGDALIKAIYERLTLCLDSCDNLIDVCQVYRFTGAKFKVLLAGDINHDLYHQLVSKFSNSLQAVSNKPLITELGHFYLGIQAGYALYPEHGISPNQLIKNSSAALIHAQKNQIKSIPAFNSELADREKNWFRLENDMREAVYPEQFFLTYQAKVNLASGQLVGMEALVRWKHPEKGLVSPIEFIPIAEESGLILPFGEWILDTAVGQLSQWLKTSKKSQSLQVAVNVSPSQLLSEGFIEFVEAVMTRHHLEASHLEVEITEEVMVDDKELCIERLNQLKRLGVSIAMDDFGTGYSSLSYLNKFPLSKLKIDRSFITDIKQNQDNLAIVSTIIALSNSLKLEVVAEGIESQEEVDVLNQMGCQQGQGYLFSKPLTNTEFEKRYL